MMTLVAVEGPDRVGKQTQVGLLAEYIRQGGKSVKVVEVPIYDVVTYHLIYLMLRIGWAKKFPRAFQTLQVLNRFIFQVTSLILYSLAYDYVIFDRWSLSTIVYGEATGTSREFNQRISSILVEPKATIVINGPARNKEARDSYEKDAALQESVRQGYSAWCRKNPDISREVSSLGTPIEVHGNVTKALKELLPTI